MKQVPQIEVRGLTHVYASGPQRLTALEDVDLEVDRGAFISVVGPSGGGKTTLLKVIGGLLEPTRGSVVVEGISPEVAQRRKAIGFVFQDPSLLPWRTVLQNIALPLQLNAGGEAGDVDEPERLMEAVGLARFRDYHPHRLSGGMRQRVALARALVLDPAVLLMDEPLGALDEMTRSVMRYELLRIWELSRKTVVFVTHSVPEAVLLADRVVVMSSQPGRVLDELRIDLSRPRDEPVERSTRFLDYVQRIKDILSMGAFGEPIPIEAQAGIQA
jgi:NitT/TauT family transport system ATP-binding protein